MTDVHSAPSAPPLVAVEGIGLQIQSFCGGISRKQWKLLTLGFPDSVTKVQLAELILQIIISVTTTSWEAVGKAEKLKKDFQARLEEQLLHSLSEALGIINVADNFSLRRLSCLIQTEVAGSVAYSTSPTTCPTFVAPAALNTMVSHISELLWRFATNMRPESLHGELEVAEDNEDNEEEPGMDVHSQASQRSEGIDELPSENTILRKTSESLQDQMSREFQELVLPLVELDSDFEKLRTEACEELQSLCEALASVICVQREKEVSQSDVRKKINQFFVKFFSRALIIRLLGKIKSKCREQSEAASTESVRFVCNIVTSWTPEDMGRKEALKATKELSSAIYRHLSADSILEGTSKCLPPSVSHIDIFGDIQIKAWIFLVIRTWWAKFQLQLVSQKVKFPVMGIVPQPSALEDPQLQLEMTRFSVEFLVQKVIFHVYLDLMDLPNNKHDITDRLLENVWAEVKGEQLQHHRNTFKKLNKTIHKVLCKKLGSPANVLLAIQSRDPVVEECIIVIVKERLLAPAVRPSANCSCCFCFPSWCPTSCICEQRSM